MNEIQQVLTGGEFQTEELAWEHFDQAARQSECFRIYREVPGEYMQPRYGCEDKCARIDRICVPTEKLIKAGWPHGPFGVEGKKSGTKIGKVLAQALDYTRCLWEIREGFLIAVNWVFVWPLDDPRGDLASLMAQHRIGYVRSWNRTPLVFSCGGMNGIVIHSDGSVEAKRFPMGNKVGSR